MLSKGDVMTRRLKTLQSIQDTKQMINVSAKFESEDISGVVVRNECYNRKGHLSRLLWSGLVPRKNGITPVDSKAGQQVFDYNSIDDRTDRMVE